MKKLVITLLAVTLLFTSCGEKEATNAGAAGSDTTEQNVLATYGTFGFDENAYTTFDGTYGTNGDMQFFNSSFVNNNDQKKSNRTN